MAKVLTVKKKRQMTLMEMMVVIFLIGVITSVVGIRYQSSLERGKYFQTKQAIEKIQQSLAMKVADGTSLDTVEDQWPDLIQDSPFINNPKDFLKDGWGQPFRVEVDRDERITVHSDKYDEYKRKNGLK